MTELNIAIANTNSAVDTEAIAEFFNQNVPEFVFSAQKSGTGTKAAFDVLGVLATISTTIADVQSIAIALKLAYDRFILPLKQTSPSAGIYVRFTNETGAESTFMLDTPQKTEVIIKRLKATSQGVSADEIHIKRS